LSPFHKRAKQLWQGQQLALKQMQSEASEFPSPSIWFHVSSLGEFEQGKPIMEALKKKYPSYRLVVTFFSPSGYQARSKNSIADATYYLPFESKSVATKVVQLLNPSLVIFVKYDLWFNYLQALKTKQIPTLLISALFRENQRFFKANAPFQRSLLQQFNFIFCQNKTSTILLNSIHFSNHLISGDTRFDRVSQHLTQAVNIPEIDLFKNNQFLLLAGSSYTIEETLLLKANAIGSNRKLIIAPHFTTPARVNEILMRFEPNAVTLTDLLDNPKMHCNKKVLIIDRIGWLANLYQYADAAFIGGGFKENGLHNILEAASFGMPICFGPKINRFPEASEMVSMELATMVTNEIELANWINYFETENAVRANKSLSARQWIQSKTGATQIILNWIQIHIKL
jgi:3-deoxy-D-manno-octulosonic-acid transferase